MLMFDPEGRPPGGVGHWVAYGIPASVDRLRRRRGQQADRQVCRRQEPDGSAALLRPCTPPGSPHHYTFVLIATDLEPTALQPGLTRDEVIKALDGHAKGAAGLVGTFSKP